MLICVLFVSYLGGVDSDFFQVEDCEIFQTVNQFWRTLVNQSSFLVPFPTGFQPGEETLVFMRPYGSIILPLNNPPPPETMRHSGRQAREATKFKSTVRWGSTLENCGSVELGFRFYWCSWTSSSWDFQRNPSYPPKATPHRNKGLVSPY